MLCFGEKEGAFDMLAVCGNVLLPFEVKVIGEEKTAPAIDRSRQASVDLTVLFNQSITEIHKQTKNNHRKFGEHINSFDLMR